MDNPHILEIRTRIESTLGQSPTCVLEVTTDLSLNPTDTRYDRPAYNTLVTDAWEYVRKTGLTASRIDFIEARTTDRA